MEWRIVMGQEAGAGAGEAGDEEAARAERKRRQRAAQEEFRRQMTKQTNKSGDG